MNYWLYTLNVYVIIKNIFFTEVLCVVKSEFTP